MVCLEIWCCGYKGENLDHNDCKMERWNFRVFWEKKSCTQIYFGSRLPCRATLYLCLRHTFPFLTFQKRPLPVSLNVAVIEFGTQGIGHRLALDILEIWSPPQNKTQAIIWKILTNLKYIQSLTSTNNNNQQSNLRNQKHLKKKHNWTSGFIMRLFFSLSLFQIKFFSFF